MLFITKRPIISAAVIAVSAIGLSAQSLPNFGFNAWESCGSTTTITGNISVNSDRPGVEPTGWNGSSLSSNTGTFETVTKQTDDDNTYVRLQNLTVSGTSLRIFKVNFRQPGSITLGTPWVCATTSTSGCDSGCYGGISFTYRPQALRLKVKRVDSNAESSNVIAYLWNGTFSSTVGISGAATTHKDNVDRAIMGETSSSGDGKLVGSVSHSFTSTNGEWQTLELPFTYNDEAGEPEMMNVIVCAGNYYNITSSIDGTTLLVDDIELVYPTTTYSGKTRVDANTKDDRAIRARSESADEYADATMTIVDYGNLVSTDDQGNRTTSGKILLPVDGVGDIELDGVELVHYDDYTWINSTEQTVTVNGEETTVTIEGSLNNDGSYRVYSEVTPASTGTPSLVSFLDATAVTTGITDIADSSTKVSVFGGQGYLHIAGVAGTINVYSLTGALIATAAIDGEGSIELPAGAVIVATPAGAVKAIVR